MIFRIIFTAIMFTGFIFAQNHTASVKGVVSDAESAAPLPGANVTIYNSADSQYVDGTASGTAGEFIISSIPAGTYFIKISYIGYQDHFIREIALSRNQHDAGTVMLQKTPVELAAANVEGERVGEELHLDKKVINVAQNLNAAGGTALDVLQNQPSVRVDPDGSVYLRGSSNFTVLINGKPSVLQGADALRQISANMIDNIELITNPSAKYDAEGSAGIININLKVQKDHSISGIANINTGTRDKYNSDFTVNYNLNGMNITGGADYRDNINTHSQNIERTMMLGEGTINNLTNLQIRDKRRQYSGRGGIDYTFNDKNSIALNLSGGKMNVRTQLTGIIENNNPLGVDFANNITASEFPVNYLNSSLNYTHKFDPQVNEMIFEATYSAVDLPSDRLTYEYLTDASYLNREPEPKITSFNNDTGRKESRIKLNYSHKISPESTIESGVQTNLNYRTFDILNRFFDWDSGDFINDINLTNNFKMRNNVYSAFATYSNRILEFDFMIGLRTEYTDRLLEQQTLGNDYKYEKLDYFPSFSLSRKIEDHQLQFSYSRRINRPNENLLNPFPFYNDSYLSTGGSPELLPEYINSFEVNYQKMFGTVFTSVQTYYRNSNNSILQKFSTDENGKMYAQFGNFAETRTYGTEISGSFAAFDILRFDPAVNLFGTELNGDIYGQKVDRSLFNWTARLNTNVTITSSTRLQISGNYFAKFVDAQTESKSFLMLSASLRQEFMEKRISLTLQGRNFFNTANIRLSNSGSNFFSNIEVRPEAPVVMLMLSYNFNNYKKPVKPADTIDIPTGL